MRIFAFFLPQFHEIPENNIWHGNGFTEWTHVKAARPLYKGHQQPKHPKNDNYYNLLNKETVLEQTKLAADYKVDGFIYYHYWFNGKLLMEKPAENLLKWKDIPQKFFFCWANHSFEKKWDGSNQMLQDQTYGGPEDWRRHFEYLLPFFRDQRYEKVDNKPVFMLYVPHFSEKKEMFHCFNRWCKDSGFKGLFLINVYKCAINEIPLGQGNSFVQMPSAGLAEYSAQNPLKFRIDVMRQKILKGLGINNKIRYNFPSADKMVRSLMKSVLHRKDLFYGLFFEWDNTPRYGKAGSVIEPLSKDVFFEYMDMLKDEKYIFVNAWNEWAEGMMLEPTEEEEYKYLDWIKEWRESRNR